MVVDKIRTYYRHTGLKSKLILSVYKWLAYRILAKCLFFSRGEIETFEIVVKGGIETFGIAPL